jgi:cysteine desulfurase
VIFGGGQEGGVRSGTENVASIAGFACAFQRADQLRDAESVRLTEIRDYVIDAILQRFPDATLNGSPTHRLPNNINICFPGTDAEFQVISLDVHGISASYSSACRTLKEDSTSYVVEAIGKAECAGSSLRFTLGRETRKGDADRLVEVLMEIIK